MRGVGVLGVSRTWTIDGECSNRSRSLSREIHKCRTWGVASLVGVKNQSREVRLFILVLRSLRLPRSILVLHISMTLEWVVSPEVGDENEDRNDDLIGWLRRYPKGIGY